VTAEYLRPLARGQRPRRKLRAAEGSLVRSFVKRMPAMVRDRRCLDRHRVVSDDEIMAWMVTK
jgi:hypothetical protein